MLRFMIKMSSVLINSASIQMAAAGAVAASHYHHATANLEDGIVGSRAFVPAAQLHYSQANITGGRGTVRVFLPDQTQDAILYVAIVVVFYAAIIFMLLGPSGKKENMVNKNRQRLSQMASQNGGKQSHNQRDTMIILDELTETTKTIEKDDQIINEMNESDSNIVQV